MKAWTMAGAPRILKLRTTSMLITQSKLDGPGEKAAAHTMGEWCTLPKRILNNAMNLDKWPIQLAVEPTRPTATAHSLTNRKCKKRWPFALKANWHTISPPTPTFPVETGLNQALEKDTRPLLRQTRKRMIKYGSEVVPSSECLETFYSQRIHSLPWLSTSSLAAKRSSTASKS